MRRTPCRQFPPAADTRLLEDALEVLLHRVGRDAKAFGDLRRGVATQDETGDVLLALGQLVGGHEQRRGFARRPAFPCNQSVLEFVQDKQGISG